MVTDELYKLNRGNQDQSVGVIIKGLNASINVLGSNSKPKALADLEDCAGEVLERGCHTFTMLPEYVYFVGSADSIEILGMSITELNITL